MADVRVGGAYVDFLTKNAKFVAGLRRNAQALRRQQRAINALKRDVRAFSRAARAMVGQLVSMRAVVGALSGSAGLGLLVKRQTAYGASLVETAERLGLTVRQLQLLRRAFESEGVPINAIDIGLQRFTRRLADAAKGNKTLQDTFRRLNVSVTDSQGRLRSNYDVLLDVADGLKAVEDQQERVRLAFTLFDSEGVRFVNALQRGGQAFDDLVESFAQLGLLTRTEVGTLKALNQSFTDIGNSLQVNLAKAVAKTNGELVALAETLAQQVPKAFEAVLNAVGFLRRHVEQITHAVQVLFGVWLLHGRIGRLAGALVTVVTQTNLWKAALVGTTVAARALGRALRTIVIVEGLIQLGKFFIALSAEIKALGTTFGDVAIVAAADFLETMTRSFVALPGLLLGIIAAAGQSIIEAFRTVGSLAWEAFKAGITGADIGKALADELQQSLAVARQNISREFQRWQIDTRALEGLSDGVAQVLGVTQADIEQARAGLRNAGRRTWDEFLRTWGLGPPEPEGTRLPGLTVLADRQPPSPRTIRQPQVALPLATPLPPSLIRGVEPPTRLPGLTVRPIPPPRVSFPDTRRAEAFVHTLREEAARAAEQVRQARLVAAAGGPGEQAALAAQFEVLNRRLAFRLQLHRELAAAQQQAQHAEVQASLALARGDVAARLTAERQEEAARTQATNLQANLRLLEAMTEETEKLTAAQAKAAEEAANVHEQQRQLEQLVFGVGQAFGAFLNNAVFGVKSLGESFKELGRIIVQQLFQIVILQPLIEQLAASLRQVLSLSGGGGGGGILGALGGLFGFGGGGSGGGPFAGLFGQGIPGFAQHGGLHQGLTVVGEGGPELADFRQPARIYPTETLRELVAGGGGPTINVHVNAEAGVSPEQVRGYVMEGMQLAVAESRASIGTDLGRRSALRSTARRR